MKENEKTKKTLEETIIITTKRIGIIRLSGNDKIEIPENNLNTALNGDLIEVSLEKKPRVINVIKRAKNKFVGTIYRKDDVYFLTPDDFRFYPHLELARPVSGVGIPSEFSNLKEDISNGNTKVLIEMSEWTNPKENPVGKIIKILGRKGENNTEMEAILYGKGFDTSFPQEVEEEANKIKNTATKEFAKEIKKRKDIRKTTTFTIDPDDAKDFDDALSFKKLKDGNYEIGIHIADVTHYVKINSIIDKEAISRATSVYLVDRTIPMLPEILSNNLCSLNPDEDKLTYSVIFTINKNTQIIDTWFGETIIHSDKRFTYKEAQGNLDRGKGDFYEELKILDELAKKIRKERAKKGAISFGSNEYKFTLDEDGKAIDVHKKELMQTNDLIEDFMLLANKAVAEFIHNQEKKLKIEIPFVYRIHDIPKVDQIKELADFLKKTGYHLSIKKNKVSSRDLNNLLEKIEGEPEENLIATAMLKSMAKAIYSTQNIGHYGLAFEHYTHFTSPIRRYPDMMVHRLMKKYLAGENISPRSIKKYKELTSRSTQQEIAAVDAERNSVRYKFTEFMSDKIGEEFEGVISGITKWGVYVQIENGANGMISLRTLKNDYYDLDTKNYSLVGQKTRTKYSLGDKIKVRLIKTNIDRQLIDFEISGGSTSGG